MVARSIRDTPTPLSFHIFPFGGFFFLLLRAKRPRPSGFGSLACLRGYSSPWLRPASQAMSVYR